MAKAKRKERKPIKIEHTENYVVEDYKNPPAKDVVAYRRKKVDGHVLTLAILKKKGPRGGRTVVTSIWHPKTEKKSSNPTVSKALKARRKSTSRGGKKKK